MLSARRWFRGCFIKVVSVVTLFCFLLTSLVVPGMATPGESSVRSGAGSDSALPYTIGRITGASRGAGDTAVILVQDLHCHAEAQRNISRIIEHFDRQFKLDDVYVEGNIGRQDTSWINAVSDERMRGSIVEALLDSGKLTGPEYYSIKSGKLQLLTGIENEKLYLDNVKRLSRMMGSREEVNVHIERMEKDLSVLRESYCSSSNQRLDRAIEKCKAGTIGNAKLYRLLTKYAEKLELPQSAYPTIAAYVELAKLQEGLDYRRVGRELNGYLVQLRGRLSYREYQALVEKAKDSSRIDEFYASLARVAREQGLTGDSRALAQFFGFIDMNRRVNPLELLQEEKKLVSLIHQKQAQSRAEREALFVSDCFSHIKDYLDNHISADEYAYLTANSDRFTRLWNQYLPTEDLNALQPYLSLAKEFYETNVARNACFLEAVFGDKTAAVPETVLAETDDLSAADGILANARRAVVIVAGGFHTKGVEELLKSKNIPCVVVTPNVTKDTNDSQQIYDELARAQGEILSQTIPPSMRNWEMLDQAATTKQYAQVLAMGIDGSFLGSLLSQYPQAKVEHYINEMLVGVRRQHDLGPLAFNIEATDGNVYHYVLKLGDTTYRFTADQEKVVPEGTAIASRDASAGKAVIPRLKKVLLPILARVMRNHPGKVEQTYDNYVGPVVEELIFTCLPAGLSLIWLTAPWTIIALAASRVAFLFLHKRGKKVDGQAFAKLQTFKHMAMPLAVSVVSVVSLLLSGNTWISTVVSIIAHITANAVIVPGFPQWGLSKAVIGGQAEEAESQKPETTDFAAQLPVSETNFDLRNIRRGPVMVQNGSENIFLIDGVVPIQGKEISKDDLARMRKKWKDLSFQSARFALTENVPRMRHILEDIDRQMLTMIAMIGAGKIDEELWKYEWPEMYEECFRKLKGIAQKREWYATPEVAAILMNGHAISPAELKALKDDLLTASAYPLKEVIIALIGAGTIDEQLRKKVWPRVYEDCCDVLISVPRWISSDTIAEVAAIVMSGREIGPERLRSLKSSLFGAESDTQREVIIAIIGAGKIAEESRKDIWPKVYEDCGKELREIAGRHDWPSTRQVAAILGSSWEIEASELEALKEAFATADDAQKEVIIAMIGAGKIAEESRKDKWPEVYEDCGKELREIAGRHNWDTTWQVAAILMSGREIGPDKLNELKEAFATANDAQKAVIIAMIGAGKIGKESLEKWPEVYKDCCGKLIGIAGRHYDWRMYQVAAILMNSQEISPDEMSMFKDNSEPEDRAKIEVIAAMIGAGRIGKEALRKWPAVYEEYYEKLIRSAKDHGGSRARLALAAAILMSSADPVKEKPNPQPIGFALRRPSFETGFDAHAGRGSMIENNGREKIYMINGYVPVRGGSKISKDTLRWMKKKWDKLKKVPRGNQRGDSQKLTIMAMIGAGKIDEELRKNEWPKVYEECINALIEKGSFGRYETPFQIAAILASNWEINAFELESLKKDFAAADDRRKEVIIAMIGAGRIDEEVRKKVWPGVYLECINALLKIAGEDNYPDGAVTPYGYEDITSLVAAILASSWEIDAIELETLKNEFYAAKNEHKREVIITIIGAGRLKTLDPWPEVYEECRREVFKLAREHRYSLGSTPWTAAILASKWKIDEADLKALKEAFDGAKHSNEKVVIISMIGAGSISEEALKIWPGVYEDCATALRIKSYGREAELMIAATLARGWKISAGALKAMKEDFHGGADEQKKVIIVMVGAGKIDEDSLKEWPEVYEECYEALLEKGKTAWGMHKIAAILMHGQEINADKLQALQNAFREANKSLKAEIIAMIGAGRIDEELRKKVWPGMYRECRKALVDEIAADINFSNAEETAAILMSSFDPSDKLEPAETSAAVVSPGRKGSSAMQLINEAAVTLGRNIGTLARVAFRTIPFVKEAVDGSYAVAKIVELLLGGEKGSDLLSDQETQERYGELLKGVKELPAGVEIRVSRAPLSRLVQSPDNFVFATNNGSRIIIHELVMDDLKAGNVSFTLNDIVGHEVKEAAFLAHNPGRTYKDYHRAVAKLDAALFKYSRQAASRVATVIYPRVIGGQAAEGPARSKDQNIRLSSADEPFTTLEKVPSATAHEISSDKELQPIDIIPEKKVYYSDKDVVVAPDSLHLLIDCGVFFRLWDVRNKRKIGEVFSGSPRQRAAAIGANIAAFAYTTEVYDPSVRTVQQDIEIVKMGENGFIKDYYSKPSLAYSDTEPSPLMGEDHDHFPHWLQGIAITPGDKYLVFHVAAGLRVFDIEKKQMVAGPVETGVAFQSFAITDDGRAVAVHNREFVDGTRTKNEIRFYEIPSLKFIKSVKWPRVEESRMSLLSSNIAVCDEGCKLHLWDVSADKAVVLCEGIRMIMGAAVSRDRKYLAVRLKRLSGGAGNAVRIYEIATGRLLVNKNVEDSKPTKMYFVDDDQQLLEIGPGGGRASWTIKYGKQKGTKTTENNSRTAVELTAMQEGKSDAAGRMSADPTPLREEREIANGSVPFISNLAKMGEAVQDRLVALFTGEKREYILTPQEAKSRYGELLKSVREDDRGEIEFSNAPLPFFVQSDDMSAFASHTDHSVIIHVSLADALLDALRKGESDVTLKDVLHYKRGLRKYLMENPDNAKAYEAYHMMHAVRDGALFDLVKQLAKDNLKQRVGLGAVSPLSLVRREAIMVAIAAGPSMVIASPLAGQGMVIAETGNTEAMIDAAVQRGMMPVVINSLDMGNQLPAAGLEKITAKVGEHGRPTGYVTVPVNGKDVEISVWRATENDSGTVRLYYSLPSRDAQVGVDEAKGLAANAVRENQTIDSREQLSALAPLYIAQWIEGNPLVQEQLRLKRFTAAVYYTGNPACRDSAVLNRLSALQNGTQDIDISKTAMVYDGDLGDGEQELSKGDTLPLLKRIFDVTGEANVATALDLAAKARQRKVTTGRYPDEPILSGVTFADLGKLRLRCKAYEQDADAYIVREIPKHLKRDDLDRFKEVVKQCLEQGKQLVVCYRLGKNEQLAEAGKNIAVMVRSGARILLDARAAEHDDAVGTWVRQMEEQQPDTFAGVIRHIGSVDDSADWRAVHGILEVPFIVRISPEELFNELSLKRVVDITDSIRSRGYRVWLSLDNGGTEGYQFDDNRDFADKLVDQADELIQKAGMFSVQDELLEACEDPIGPTQGILLKLRRKLEKQLNNIRAFVFDRGRIAARREKVSAAVSVKEIADAVNSYRSNPQGASLKVVTESFQDIKDKSLDYQAGYLYGILENEAGITLDSWRPYLDQRYSVQHKRAVVELELYLVGKGIEPVQLLAPKDIPALLKQVQQASDARELTAAETEFTSMSRQLVGVSSTAKDAYVQQRVGILSDKYRQLLRNRRVPHPLAIAAALNMFDLAKRDERRWLDIPKPNIEILTEAVKMIDSAA